MPDARSRTRSRTILSTSVLLAPALAAALACSGAATANATAPADRPAPAGHRLAFKAQHTGIVATGRRDYVLTDDVVRHGHVVGADVLSCRTTGRRARCLVTLGLGDGQLHFRITMTEDGDLRGTVIGGEGRYAGAAGRVRGHALSEQAERVVVHWHR